MKAGCQRARQIGRDVLCGPLPTNVVGGVHMEIPAYIALIMGLSQKGERLAQKDVVYGW
jgi:hypothetical protein